MVPYAMKAQVLSHHSSPTTQATTPTDTANCSWKDNPAAVLACNLDVWDCSGSFAHSKCSTDDASVNVEYKNPTPSLGWDRRRGAF